MSEDGYMHVFYLSRGFVFMKKFIGVLSICVIGLCSSMASAEDSSNFARNGAYIGVGGIYAHELFDDNGDFFKDSAGFNARLGYRFHPNIAIEAEGERVIGFDLKGTKADVETWVATINGKFFALTGQVQPFLLVGVGAMVATADFNTNGFSNNTETDVVGRIGGGVDAYVTENWLVNFEVSYVSPRGDVDDVDYLGVGGGIQYRF